MHGQRVVAVLEPRDELAGTLAGDDVDRPVLPPAAELIDRDGVVAAAPLAGLIMAALAQVVTLLQHGQPVEQEFQAFRRIAPVVDRARVIAPRPERVVHGDPARLEDPRDLLRRQPRPVDVLEHVGGEDEIERVVGDLVLAVGDIGDHRVGDIGLDQIEVVIPIARLREMIDRALLEIVPADLQDVTGDVQAFEVVIHQSQSGVAHNRACHDRAGASAPRTPGPGWITLDFTAASPGRAAEFTVADQAGRSSVCRPGASRSVRSAVDTVSGRSVITE